METLFSFLRDIMTTIRHGGWPELGVWSYVLLGVLVATEGPITTLIGGAAAAAGYLDVWYVLLAAALGNVTGDSLWYTIGYISKLETIYRYGRWLGLRNHHMDRIALEMQSHATKLIVLSKISYGLMVPTLVAAGLARVSWRRWLPTVLILETIWTITLVTIGFHAAGAISKVGRSLQLIGIVVLIALMAAIFWYVRRIFRRSAHEDEPLEEAAPFATQEGGAQKADEHSAALSNGLVAGDNLTNKHRKSINHHSPASSASTLRKENQPRDYFSLSPSTLSLRQPNEQCHDVLERHTSAKLDGVKTPLR